MSVRENLKPRYKRGASFCSCALSGPQVKMWSVVWETTDKKHAPIFTVTRTTAKKLYVGGSWF